MENIMTAEQTQSESITNLIKAVIKLQAGLDFVAKGNDNPFFKSKYADLASCWETLRKPLSDNGLCIIQLGDKKSDDGRTTTVATMLCHSSGEWVKSYLTMPLVKNDPQAVGSAVTYARRYSLQMITGLIADDDDGETAMGRGWGNQQTVSMPTKAPSKKFDPVNERDKLTRYLYGAMCGEKGLGLTKDEMLYRLEQETGRKISHSSELTDMELVNILSKIRAEVKKMESRM